MNRIFKVVSVGLGSWLGWWLGFQVNIWWALVLGTIGTAVGWYAYRRYLSRLL